MKPSQKSTFFLQTVTLYVIFHFKYFINIIWGFKNNQNEERYFTMPSSDFPVGKKIKHFSEIEKIWHLIYITGLLFLWCCQKDGHKQLVPWQVCNIIQPFCSGKKSSHLTTAMYQFLGCSTNISKTTISFKGISVSCYSQQSKL